MLIIYYNINCYNHRVEGCDHEFDEDQRVELRKEPLSWRMMSRRTMLLRSAEKRKLPFVLFAFVPCIVTFTGIG